jgi:formamidopyrimidine-DNA glycosylase
MPELPEVETTRRGLLPKVVGRTVRRVVVRDARLRWPVPDDLAARLEGRRVGGISRRGKYLLFDFGNGHLLVHLGMSGSLRALSRPESPRDHDHVDIEFDDRSLIRLTDPRRFGAVLWAGERPEAHALLRDLGPEPLGECFSGRHLFDHSRGRRVAVKQFLMDAHTVTGIGNIYASEALYHAGIHPSRAAGRIALARYDRLAAAIRETLERALAAGGSTLRDFVGSDGRPGYFQRESAVYDRAGLACRACGTAIRTSRHGARSTYFCPRCQH